MAQVLGTAKGTGFGAMLGFVWRGGTVVVDEDAWELSIGGKTLLFLRTPGGVLGRAGDGTLGIGPLPALDPEVFGIVGISCSRRR